LHRERPGTHQCGPDAERAWQVSEISPLELWARRMLGLNSIVGEPFGPRMLAAALRKVDEADPQFQERFHAALADALMDKDGHWRLDLVSHRRGQPGKGGLLATQEEFDLAAEVLPRSDKESRGAAAEPQAKVLREIMDRPRSGMTTEKQAKKRL